MSLFLYRNPVEKRGKARKPKELCGKKQRHRNNLFMYGNPAEKRGKARKSVEKRGKAWKSCTLTFLLLYVDNLIGNKT